MKYEVIGWTYCGSGRYPRHKVNTASVEAAIAKVLREKKYCFGGDVHEDYCPVLNDGTHVSFSWRGWGGVMARARGEKDPMAYMGYYMESLINPKIIKHPKFGEGIDDQRIASKETLADTFVMHLSADMFKAVSAGTKTVELRLFDDKRKLVDIGDYIRFVNIDDESQSVLKKVADIEIEQSFRKLLTRSVYLGKDGYADGLRFTPEELGASDDCDLNALESGMYKYYTKEQEKEHGVIAFILQDPKPVCNTHFTIWTLYEYNCEEYVRRLESEGDNFNDDEYFNDNLIEEELETLSEEFRRRSTSFVYGDNDEYNEDVNVMLRKTLEGLMDKTEELKALQKRFCISMTLDVWATTVRGYDKPQRLTLDKDIEEFLKNANVRFNLETNEIVK